MPIEIIDGIQLDMEKTVVYIKIVSKEEYDKACENIVGEYEFEDNVGKKWMIPVREITEITFVRVLNVPFEVPMDIVVGALTAYGKVLSSDFEKWGRGYALPVKNGVRVFKMVLDMQIPSYIPYGTDDEDDVIKAQVVYSGQKRTCKICNAETHFVRDCPRRRNVYRRQPDYYYRHGRPDINSQVEFPNITDPQASRQQQDKQEEEKSQDTNKEEGEESQEVVEMTQTEENEDNTGTDRKRQRSLTVEAQVGGGLSLNEQAKKKLNDSASPKVTPVAALQKLRRGSAGSVSSLLGGGQRTRTSSASSDSDCSLSNKQNKPGKVKKKE